MQNTVCKLTNKMLLGIMALSLSMPNQTEANMGYMVTATAGYNFLLRKLQQTIKGILVENKSDASNNSGTSSSGNFASGEAETERDFLRGLDLGVGFYAINKVNDIFGMGAGVNLGWSFSKEEWKGSKALYLSEGFVAKLGMAITITDWVMLSLGVRMSYLTYGYDKPEKDEDGRQKLDLFKDSTSSSAWAVGLYGDVNLLIPVTDNVRFVVTLGIFGDLNAPEFRTQKDKVSDKGLSELAQGLLTIKAKEAAEKAEKARGTAAEAAEAAAAVAAEAAVTDRVQIKAATAKLPDDVLTTQIQNRLGMRIGLGVAFSF